MAVISGGMGEAPADEPMEPVVSTACSEGLGSFALRADAWIVSGGLDGSASGVVAAAMASLGERAAAAGALKSAAIAIAPLPAVQYHERFLADPRHQGTFVPTSLELVSLEALPPSAEDAIGGGGFVVRCSSLEAGGEAAAAARRASGGSANSLETGEYVTTEQVLEALGRASLASTRAVAEGL